MMRSLIVLFIGVTVAACASSSTTAGASRCGLNDADSVYLASGPVYRDCAVEHRAVAVDRNARPDFHPSGLPPGGSACYSADVDFVVDATGAPEAETMKVARTNNPDFAAAAVAAMQRWRYQPARIGGAPVRQIVREHLALAEVVVAAPMGEPPRPGRPPTC